MTLDRQTDGEALPNPFSVTKAGYFTDAEIHSTWVDWPAPGGFAELVNVDSRMPRFILGGKGSGRTHMMRHFSAPVQLARGRGEGVQQVLEDGVLGVYLMCSNLNASRFGGGQQDISSWQFLFAQYMDLWLARAALDAFEMIAGKGALGSDVEAAAADEILNLLEVPGIQSEPTLETVRATFVDLQRTIDSVVNNAMLNPSTSLAVVAHSNLGRLVAGVPRILMKHCDALSDVIWLYLIDEHENLNESQQQYINSLIRESMPGVSFAVGVRTYGLRTYAILGGIEENRRGSEFEEVRLDRVFGEESDLYRQFCHSIVARRLSDARSPDVDAGPGVTSDFARAFQRRDNSWVEREIKDRYEPTQRPYMTRLRDQLQRYGYNGEEQKLTHRDVDGIIEALYVPERPMLEKANILLLYREWAAGRDLLGAADQFRAERAVRDATQDARPTERQRRVLEYFASDLRAQLHRDMRRRGPQYYAGLEEFIVMSDNLPRNLLVILKNVHRWAVFYGERPFTTKPISLDAQRMGVWEAAEWFYADAKPLGKDGEIVHGAVARLADMFRRLRFSDKPAESSLVGFSTDLSKCSARTRELVDLAQKWSLLVPNPHGQKARNTQALEPKFHLNRMLCPLWDLPIGRRGAMQLAPTEMNAIFDPDEGDRYRLVVNRRLARMNVPFGRAGHLGESQGAFRLPE